MYVANLWTQADPALRLQLAGDALLHTDLEIVVGWLEQQGLTVATPPQKLRPGAIAIARALCLNPPSTDRLNAIAERAMEAGRSDLAAVLHASLETVDGNRDDPVLDRDLLQQTVGRRVSQARSGAPDTLARLVLDDEPRVLEALLANPRTTITHVLRLATRRPSPVGAMPHLLAHSQWSANYSVQRSIARNETIAPRAVLAMTLLLNPTDLAAVAEDRKALPAQRRIARFRQLTAAGAGPEPAPPNPVAIQLDPPDFDL